MLPDVLQLPFMRRALIAGVIVGVLASYYGVFVVQRRLSFLGVGLSHAAFGGVALGLLLQINPIWTALPFTVAVALGITAVTHVGTVSGDTAIGVFFSAALAIGVVLLTFKQSYTTDAFTYLFGSILAVRPVDLWILGGIAFLAMGSLPLWGRWAYATFDRDLARADGVPVDRDDYVLATLLAVTIVAAVKVVGIVLAAAFFVIPAAAARLLTGTFRGMTILAVGVGACTAVFGLGGSYAFDLPSGAAIILVQAVVFGGAVLIGGE
ncbi:MAG TPA: metal ABC transporter permease [Salinibacter sp.]|nr:metal ABC transporter permease [Salinibacter sp.]